MHIPLTPAEREALRLAARLCGAPDDIALARDAVLRAIADIFTEEQAKEHPAFEFHLFAE